jgi:hypothetical protein
MTAGEYLEQVAIKEGKSMQRGWRRRSLGNREQRDPYQAHFAVTHDPRRTHAPPSLDY